MFYTCMVQEKIGSNQPAIESPNSDTMLKKESVISHPGFTGPGPRHIIRQYCNFQSQSPVCSLNLH